MYYLIREKDPEKFILSLNKNEGKVIRKISKHIITDKASLSDEITFMAILSDVKSISELSITADGYDRILNELLMVGELALDTSNNNFHIVNPGPDLWIYVYKMVLGHAVDNISDMYDFCVWLKQHVNEYDVNYVESMIKGMHDLLPNLLIQNVLAEVYAEVHDEEHTTDTKEEDKNNTEE